MTADTVLFAGLCLTSRRKPITFAALNSSLEIEQLVQWDTVEVVNCIHKFESVHLAIHVPGSKGGRKLYGAFLDQIAQDGFSDYFRRSGSKLWIASNADAAYRVFQPEMLPKRSLECRIQRGLILYEEGLQVKDPMDFFEEFPRYKLMQGLLPMESIYLPNQLDALMMAYVSWLAGNPAERGELRSDLLLPAPGESNPVHENQAGDLDGSAPSN